ncbi:MAG TPA: mechanosensitive ion channel domain-containing protein [Planctomycetaceae bacterium]|nr:mechanosensitive ion channel domain-containing protein [Planctomycetaceae bacterium]
MKVRKDAPGPSRAVPWPLALCLVAVLLVAACLSSGSRLFAAPPPATTDPLAGITATKPEPVTSEAIETRRKDVRKAKEIDEETRTKVFDLYQQALDSLKAAQDFAAKTAASKKQAEHAKAVAEEAKSELKRRREELEQVTKPLSAAGAAPAPVVAPAEPVHSVTQLEADLAAASTARDGLNRKQAQLEKEASRRSTRRKEIRERLLVLHDEIVELRKQVAAPLSKDEAAALVLARRALAQAKVQSIEQEAPSVRAELAQYDAEDAVDLIRLQRDVLVQRIAFEEHRIKEVTELLDRTRRIEADRAVAVARRLEVEAHPLLQALTAENTRLAEDSQKLSKPIETAEDELKKAKAALEKFTKQFAQIKQKADGVGLTNPIGQLLRKQRADLPDPPQRSVDASTQLIDEAQFRLYELDENRSSLANPEPLVQSILSQAPPTMSDESRRMLEKASRDVLESKQKSLDTLTRNLSNYCDTLLELVFTQRKLIVLLNEYAQYIDERVLWIRSSRPLAAGEVFRGRAITWLVRPSNWMQVASALWSDSRANPFAFCAFLQLAAGFWYVRRRFRGEIQNLGHDAQRSNFTRYLPTLRAFGLTLATSLAGTGLLAFVGRRLAVAAYDVDFPSAVSDALYATAWLYLPLDLIRRTCRRDGLAESHFGWPPAAARAIARDVWWLMVIGLPLTFVSELLHASDPDSVRNAWDRLLFAIGMVSIAIFIFRAVRPHVGIVRELFPAEQDEWIVRLERLGRWAGTIGALLLAALVVGGYDYTARQFVWRLYLSGMTLLAGFYTRALLARWILVHRRLMGMQQLKERRVTELRSTVSSDASVVAAVHTEPVPKIDLATLSAQTRTLVNVGVLSSLFVSFWWIWLDVFPSMGILNQWQLWSTTVGDAVIPITVANLVSALAIGALTWIATRNIPGLLEMTVLQRLPIDNAGRFAFSTLARYAIVVIGLASASSTIGIGWQKVQWLATALTFGLAFGLQEIFANFIAGLIILFERPIRVGDMVTIDNVTGVVTRIRIRATTIGDSDRKEYIVPNKEFITGRTLNWTLSDTINRIVINVGIAYGSDTELARDLLLKAAHDHPAVLRDPEPSASFEEFGETALKLILRCFLPNLTERTRVIHELHTAINRSFAEHGIEIPVVHPEAVTKPSFPLIAKKGGEGESDLHSQTAGHHEPEAA